MTARNPPVLESLMFWRRRRIDSQTTPSLIPSYGGPSHQTHNIDLSQTQISRSYRNSGYHASGQGIINTQTNYNYYRDSSSSKLEELEKRCSPSAAFDSATRFDPPHCAESTRLRITQSIEEWIMSDGGNAVPSSLFWLHGGAGVGKSAIAQSLSEKFQKKEQLAASFFFFRSDPLRNNGDHLIPTLVSHLLDSFEGIGPLVEDRIRKNRALFTKRYEMQIQELLIKPLLALESKGVLFAQPRLIVIDGLDECQNPDIQSELLRAIAHAIALIPYPLRFFVTSRPEAHITHVFDHDHDLKAITAHRYNLSDDPDAETDIRRFLETEFEEIRRVHRLGSYLPHDWPGRKVLTALVERSSGHFIYASTVIRYIQSPKHRPDDRLEVILRLRPPQEGDRPYAQLDALYELIFQGVKHRGQLENICLVLGILYLQSQEAGFFGPGFSVTIERLLEMKAGDLILLLDPILSLVAIDGHAVRMLHKSLFDHLLDSDRRGCLPFDLARVHESAATYILKERILKDVLDMDDFQDFAYHCRYAYLNDILKGYLHSLEVPYPKSVKSVHDEHIFVRELIWHFSRVLWREEFDSTGQFCEQYTAKWLAYLRSSISIHTEPPSRKAVAKVNDLKTILDKLLKEWTPQNLMEVGNDAERWLPFIEREHDIFLAHADASTPQMNVSACSLIIGDHFIHSYYLKNEDHISFFFLHSYSRHVGASHRHASVGTIDAVQKTEMFLKELEKYLSSDLYQKYGLEPE